MHPSRQFIGKKEHPRDTLSELIDNVMLQGQVAPSDSRQTNGDSQAHSSHPGGTSALQASVGVEDNQAPAGMRSQGSDAGDAEHSIARQRQDVIHPPERGASPVGSMTDDGQGHNSITSSLRPPCPTQSLIQLEPTHSMRHSPVFQAGIRGTHSYPADAYALPAPQSTTPNANHPGGVPYQHYHHHHHRQSVTSGFGPPMPPACVPRTNTYCDAYHHVTPQDHPITHAQPDTAAASVYQETPSQPQPPHHRPQQVAKQRLLLDVLLATAAEGQLTDTMQQLLTEELRRSASAGNCLPSIRHRAAPTNPSRSQYAWHRQTSAPNQLSCSDHMGQHANHTSQHAASSKYPAMMMQHDGGPAGRQPTPLRPGVTQIERFAPPTQPPAVQHVHNQNQGSSLPDLLTPESIHTPARLRPLQLPTVSAAFNSPQRAPPSAGTSRGDSIGRLEQMLHSPTMRLAHWSSVPTSPIFPTSAAVQPGTAGYTCDPVPPPARGTADVSVPHTDTSLPVTSAAGAVLETGQRETAFMEGDPRAVVLLSTDGVVDGLCEPTRGQVVTTGMDYEAGIAGGSNAHLVSLAQDAGTQVDVSGAAVHNGWVPVSVSGTDTVAGIQAAQVVSAHTAAAELAISTPFSTAHQQLMTRAGSHSLMDPPVQQQPYDQQGVLQDGAQACAHFQRQGSTPAGMPGAFRLPPLPCQQLADPHLTPSKHSTGKRTVHDMQAGRPVDGGVSPNNVHMMSASKQAKVHSGSWPVYDAAQQQVEVMQHAGSGCIGEVPVVRGAHIAMERAASKDLGGVHPAQQQLPQAHSLHHAIAVAGTAVPLQTMHPSTVTTGPPRTSSMALSDTHASAGKHAVGVYGSSIGDVGAAFVVTTGRARQRERGGASAGDAVGKAITKRAASRKQPSRATRSSTATERNSPAAEMAATGGPTLAPTVTAACTRAGGKVVTDSRGLTQRGSEPTELKNSHRKQRQSARFVRVGGQMVVKVEQPVVEREPENETDGAALGGSVGGGEGDGDGEEAGEKRGSYKAHPQVERNRRDVINTYINELRVLVPAGPHSPTTHYLRGCDRRPKHAVLQETIQALKQLQARDALLAQQVRALEVHVEELQQELLQVQGVHRRM